MIVRVFVSSTLDKSYQKQYPRVYSSADLTVDVNYENVFFKMQITFSWIIMFSWFPNVC